MEGRQTRLTEVVRPTRVWQLAIAVAVLTSTAHAENTQLVSVNGLGTASANASSMVAAISADGHLVAFASTASDIAGGNITGFNNVFARNVSTGTTMLVSVDTSGTTSGDADSFGPPNGPVISADGVFVAFESYADNLVALPTLNTTNIFRRNLQAGATALVTVNDAGTAGGNSGSGFPVLSADGSRVAYQSNASDLVTQPTNGVSNAFVTDLSTSETQLLSINTTGTASGNASAVSPIISADGSVIAFISFADNLTPLPTEGRSIFARNLTSATTTLVSVNRAATGNGNSDSMLPALSSDGRFIAFESIASDLVDEETNGTMNIFVRDLLANTTTLVSINAAGTAGGNLDSSNPVISADGRFVAFVSLASDLVDNDANGLSDVFVRDLVARTTILVSVNAANSASGNDASDSPSLSASGHRIAFASFASDLVANDTNQSADVFVHDLLTGTTTLVSANSTGSASANDASGNPVLSADGQHVAFESLARDLVANFVDGNGFGMDVFTATVPPPPCAGDCDGNGRVSVDELVQGVNIALGEVPLATCPAFDVDRNGIVTVNELVAAVNNALNGCPD